jgi:hypothetical protein
MEFFRTPVRSQEWRENFSKPKGVLTIETVFPRRKRLSESR